MKPPRKTRIEFAKDGYPLGTTLCWDCANALGGCSWSKSFTPVEGWTAIRHKRRYNNDKNEGRLDCDSYKVIDCPEFIRDSYMEIGKQKIVRIKPQKGDEDDGRGNEGQTQEVKES